MELQMPKDPIFGEWRLHEDEGQKWTAGTLGERSVESQCEIISKTEINEKMNLS